MQQLPKRFILCCFSIGVHVAHYRLRFKLLARFDKRLFSYGTKMPDAGRRSLPDFSAAPAATPYAIFGKYAERGVEKALFPLKSLCK
ncbi:MAG: hypothetical protein K2J31_04425 [Alistipes sp.]|nr:hypothetical protein [Alistipes sp.]